MRSLPGNLVKDGPMDFRPPCIAGTKITTADVLALLAEGMSRSKIKKKHKELTDQDIANCLEYAAGPE